jgi:hypothetical protein
MSQLARLLPCAVAACILCLDASAASGIADPQSPVRKVRKDAEMRRDGPMGLGAPYSGPAIGTRIGQPLGSKQNLDQQPMKGGSLGSQRFFEGLAGSDGGRADVGQAIRAEAAESKKAADKLNAGQASNDQLLRELQGAQGTPKAPNSTVKPCKPDIDCGYSRVSPR